LNEQIMATEAQACGAMAQSDDELDELQLWALDFVLSERLGKTA
jgi:hypothetical protein